MIVTVRDRVQRMINSGQTEAQVVGQHPTSTYDGATAEFKPMILCVPYTSHSNKRIGSNSARHPRLRR
jgi:hypothetical protein